MVEQNENGDQIQTLNFYGVCLCTLISYTVSFGMMMKDSIWKATAATILGRKRRRSLERRVETSRAFVRSFGKDEHGTKNRKEKRDSLRERRKEGKGLLAKERERVRETWDTGHGTCDFRFKRCMNFHSHSSLIPHFDCIKKGRGEGQSVHSIIIRHQVCGSDVSFSFLCASRDSRFVVPRLVPFPVKLSLMTEWSPKEISGNSLSFHVQFQRIHLHSRHYLSEQKREMKERLRIKVRLGAKKIFSVKNR